MAVDETFETWTCDCKPSREWHSPRHCGAGRPVTRPVPPLYDRKPVGRPVTPASAVGLPTGPTGPLKVGIAVAEWPARARILAPHVIQSSRVTGRPAPGADPVTSLRLVGEDWWAVWEDGRYHCGLCPNGLVPLGQLVAWASR
jgi:hypothetical protein